MAIIPTILCGGAGSRLWPISRELHPKPFIRLNDGESLLQKTFLRGAFLPDVKEIVTVTNRELLFKTTDEFRETKQNHLSQSYILEPFGKNTAAAVTAAALQINKTHGKDAIMLVMPADHLISDYEAFQNAVEEALALAKQDKLVTFGIRPEGPETGYGYIEAKGNEVLNFIEKPSLEKAEEFLKSGSFLWNSGMFCFKASTLLAEMAIYDAEILEKTKACMDASSIAKGKNFSQLELDAESFANVPDNSIDYALIEKSKSVAVVPCQIGWSDIGSWNSLGSLTQADTAGNRTEGEVLLHEVNDCYIRGKDRLIAAVGVNNLFVIDTPDALLVANKSHAQEVKAIYARLKEEQHETHKLHRTVHRPWGTYTILEEGLRYKIKLIEVIPGASLSLQMHYHRSEHWIVVSGMAKVVNGDKEMYISPNESTYVPAGHKHRLENPGLTNLIMIEVQCGEYMGEDDIVRFEDVYGRV
ncbi:MAG: mannose-1-phosphate guanylyltransferase/mannose-6-phosphate isomerase [Proteobacteria bacterium]|nr:mannose-1-phosphate guanylyltransferase/mannose-6-phosphate isomerase [Pseudomonadota bacterium]